MPLDPRRLRLLLRQHLLELANQAGDGEWSRLTESEPTPDGRTVLVISAIPVSELAGPPPAPVEPEPANGRPAVVPREVLEYLLTRPAGFHYSEILEAMREHGHGDSSVGAALKALERDGLATHAGRGEPYIAYPFRR